jgi:hypothetical protein
MSFASSYMSRILRVVAVGFGLAASAWSSASTPTAAKPVFSPAAGTYTAAQSVNLSDKTKNAAIYYTLNGATPTASSTKYIGAIKVAKTETIKAIAIATGYNNSAVASATYTIQLPTATPVFSLATGSYTGAQSVKISDKTKNASIYYTVDGDAPTIYSTPYSSAIQVGSTETVKAVAIAPGSSVSAVASATYTIQLPTAVKPVFSPAAGTYTAAQSVTLSDKTKNAAIYYTLDGSVPTAKSIQYAGAIQVSSTKTIKAIAIASGYNNSAVTSAAYTIQLTPITVSLGSNPVLVPQDGVSVAVPVTISAPLSSASVTVTINGLPEGVTEQFKATGSGPSGTLTFTGSSSAAAGSYPLQLVVNQSGNTASKSFTLISAVVAKVATATDKTLGVKGVLKQFMSTSFQVAEWDGDFLGTDAAAREATLSALGPQHIRLQSVSEGVPMSTNTGTASDWDFTILDQTVQPVLTVGDKSPELQIAEAPAWMETSGVLDIDNHLSDFATYAANLVKYYNKGGFTWGGTTFKSASSQPITWWGVFNEPDYNGLTGAQYVKLYNTVVPAMLKVDPTIKFSALEFSGSDLGTGWSSDPELYLPPFFAAASAGGVSAQVNIVSNHFYSTCYQTDTDATIFATIPQFVAVENYIYQEIQSRSDLAKVPVWTTENNVNADYANSEGMSSCDPSIPFVVDQRGSSAFFAAWRTYLFSQLGKAGNQALFQWAYDGDQQYGEVDTSGNPYLSYWVDKALESIYPSTTAAPGPSILTLSATETSTVETLATKNSNKSVVVMVVDRAVDSDTDNNGSGDPRSVVVDTTSLGTFKSASLLTIDAATNTTSGPVAASVTPAKRFTITLPGYGVAFLTLTP